MADDTPVAATPDDVRSAIESANTQDPDVIPAGGQQATSTEEAHQEAKKILSRVGSHDADAAQLKKDIESNAEASRAALVRAQRLFLEHPELTFQSPQEIIQRRAAAFMTPQPGVGVAGELMAQGANAAAERAQEEEAYRQALGSYYSNLSGLPLQEQLSKINQQTEAAKQKLLEMSMKSDTELGKSAMTALGRVAATPGAQAGLKPWGTFGKNAVDTLGSAAFINGKDATAGFTPAYHALVNRQLEAQIAEQRSRAGIDEIPLTPEEKLELANVSGVPVAPIGLPDVSHIPTQQRRDYFKSQEAIAGKQLEAYGAADQQIRTAQAALDEFQRINAVTHTGPELAAWRIGGVHAGPHGVGADVGDESGLNIWPPSIIAGFDPNIQTMHKDANAIIGLAIPDKGFGRVTNRDLGVFQNAMIGIDKNRITNDHVAQALRIRLQNDLDRHIFEQAYFGVHRSLQGAEANWDRYLQANPIFDAKAADKLTPAEIRAGKLVPLNKNRMSWDNWFRQENNNRGAIRPSTLTREQLHGVDPNDPALAGLTDQEKIDATTPAQATGGPVHMAEGGQPEDSSELNDALRALAEGLSFKTAGIEENPGSPFTNFAGEVAGGGLSTLAALAALRRPQAIGRFLETHPKLAASGAGALAGGITGQMDTGSPWGGAATGAIMGPAASAGIRGGLRLGTDAIDRLRGQIMSPGTRRSVEAILADTGGDPSKVGAALERDAVSRFPGDKERIASITQGVPGDTRFPAVQPRTPSNVNLLTPDQKLGVPSTLAEAAGPRSTGLLTAALKKDTPETNALLQQLQERQAGAGERVYDQTNQALAPDNYLSKTQELRDALYEKARPLYEQAYSQWPSVKAPSLQQILSTPDGQEAAARAFRMMQNMRIPIGATDAVGMVQNPSLQYLDQVKRALDDMIVREEGVGPNYQATNQGRVLRQMRTQLVDELDKATMGPNGQPSPYRAARDQYGGDLDVLDSLRAGRETFPKLTADEVRQTMQKLDWSSRDAFRSGVAEGIFQQIQGMGPNRNAAQAVLANPKLQEKLMAIFDDPKSAARFVNALEREAAIFQSGQRMTSAGEKGLLQSMAPTSISQMLRTQLMPKETAGEIADTLGTTALDPDAQAKMQRLRDVADRLKARSSASSIAGTAGAAGLATGMTPSPMQGQQ